MTQEEFHKHMTFGLCTYKTGTGTRGRGSLRRFCGDLEMRDEGLGDIKYGTRDVKYRDAGDAGTLMNISLKYLFLRENVLFMVSIRFHRPEPLWIPYDVYTKYFRI